MNKITVDNVLVIETPEGVEIELTPAGPLVRMFAYLIDLSIRGSIFALCAITILPTLVLDKAGIGIFLIAYFLLEWFYPVIFELTMGTTPGKRFFKLMVCHADATPITLRGSMVRNLLRAVDALPAMYFFGLISVVLTRRFQRLGDIAAATVVVYEGDKHKQHDPFAAIQSIRPSQTFSLEQRYAIIDFAERSQHLHPERQLELANKLAPLLDKQDNPLQQLHGYAKWWHQGDFRASTDKPS